jgi:hypothetical protein
MRIVFRENPSAILAIDKMRRFFQRIFTKEFNRSMDG